MTALVKTHMYCIGNILPSNSFELRWESPEGPLRRLKLIAEVGRIGP